MPPRAVPFGWECLRKPCQLQALEDYEEEATGHLWRKLKPARKKAEKGKKYVKRWDNLDRYVVPRTWIAFEECWNYA